MKREELKVASKIKKMLTYVLLSVLVFSNMPNNAYSVGEETTSKANIIEPQAEQVSWYYRYVDGRKQKRLWSHTYGHWITDWMWA